MANFLTRLAERTLGTVPVAQPIIAPMFAPQPITSPSPLYETSFAVESEIETPATRHMHQKTPQPQGLRSNAMSQESYPSKQPAVPATNASFQEAYTPKQPEVLSNNPLSQEHHTSKHSEALSHKAEFQAPYLSEQLAVPTTNTFQEQHFVEQSAIYTSGQQTVESRPVSKPLVSTAINHPMQLESVMPASNMSSHDEFPSSPLVQDSPAQAQHLDPARDIFHEQVSTFPIQATPSQQTTTPNERRETQQSETHSRRETLFPGRTHASLVVHPSTQQALAYKEHTINTAPSASPLIHQQATINGVLISHEHTESALHENDSIVPSQTSEETQLLVPSFSTPPSIVPASPSRTPEGMGTPLDSFPVHYTAIPLEQPALTRHTEQEAQQQERTLLPQTHQPLPNDLSGSPDRKRSQNAASTHTYQTSRNVQALGTVASIPTIHVTIGSIDVRAIMPSPPSAPRPQPSKTSSTLSLQDYARQRKGGER